MKIVENAILEQELKSELLLDDARKVAGLTDFGDETFIEPLDRLLQACTEEGDITEQGLVNLKADYQRILVNMLRMQDDINQHPEILEEDVSDAIMVTGVVRTGTSKFQRDIAADPGLRSIPFWQVLYWARFPGEDETGWAPRREFAIKAGGHSGHDLDTTQAGHAFAMDMAEDDMFLFEASFEHIYHFLRTKVPSYLSWVGERSQKSAYQSYKKILQYIQWQAGGRQGKPLLLKSPSHIGSLHTFFETFPNATLIQTHRDPCSSIPSFSKLQEQAWPIHSDPGSREYIGQAMLDLWSDQIRRNLKERQTLDKKYTLIDVPYKRIKDEPIAVIEEIYAQIGRPFTDEARESIRVWGEKNKQHKWGKHSYDGKDFGLSKEKIDTAFADYIEQFAHLIY